MQTRNDDTRCQTKKHTDQPFFFSFLFFFFSSFFFAPSFFFHAKEHTETNHRKFFFEVERTKRRVRTLAASKTVFCKRNLAILNLAKLTLSVRTGCNFFCRCPWIYYKPDSESVCKRYGRFMEGYSKQGSIFFSGGGRLKSNRIQGKEQI